MEAAWKRHGSGMESEDAVRDSLPRGRERELPPVNASFG